MSANLTNKRLTKTAKTYRIVVFICRFQNNHLPPVMVYTSIDVP